MRLIVAQGRRGPRPRAGMKVAARPTAQDDHDGLRLLPGPYTQLYEQPIVVRQHEESGRDGSGRMLPGCVDVANVAVIGTAELTGDVS